MYVLFSLGPDDYSTYDECWGALATSDGVEIKRSSDLRGLLRYVDDFTHDNFWVRGPGRRHVAGSRKEFHSLPTIRRILNRHKSLIRTP